MARPSAVIRAGAGRPRLSRCGVETLTPKPRIDPGAVGCFPTVIASKGANVSAARVQGQGGVDRQFLPGEKSGNLQPVLEVRQPAKVKRSALVPVLCRDDGAVSGGIVPKRVGGGGCIDAPRTATGNLTGQRVASVAIGIPRGTEVGGIRLTRGTIAGQRESDIAGIGRRSEGDRRNGLGDHESVVQATGDQGEGRGGLGRRCVRQRQTIERSRDAIGSKAAEQRIGGGGAHVEQGEPRDCFRARCQIGGKVVGRSGRGGRPGGDGGPAHRHRFKADGFVFGRRGHLRLRRGGQEQARRQPPEEPGAGLEPNRIGSGHGVRRDCVVETKLQDRARERRGLAGMFPHVAERPPTPNHCTGDRRGRGGRRRKLKPERPTAAAGRPVFSQKATDV